jgi:hypothetical protein
VIIKEIVVWSDKTRDNRLAKPVIIPDLDDVLAGELPHSVIADVALLTLMVNDQAHMYGGLP